jgi:hypothetical protein
MRYFALAVLLLAPVAPASAQHSLGARQQWQPQVTEGGFDPDQRLEQTVKLDILGRSAISTLAILSQATGIGLYVAPEDLATVGERKLSIFAFDGIRLKDLMVQIPEALQEGHWDIDESGEKPVYLLHRNAGAEETIAWLSEREKSRRHAERRAKRVARVEAARQGLLLSPQEMAELEETDLFLARGLRDSELRSALELFLSLPPEHMEQFLDTGTLSLEFASAPERWRQAARRVVEQLPARLAEIISRAPIAPDPGAPDMVAPLIKCWQENDLSHATLSYEDRGAEFGDGILLCVRSAPCDEIVSLAIPPKYPEGPSHEVARLLSPAEFMGPILPTWGQKPLLLEREERERRLKAQWIDPDDLQLHGTLCLGEQQFSELAEIQRAIARKTGLSIISDYFTFETAPALPDEARNGMPLWRLLYLIGEDPLENRDVYLWHKLGKCIVFRCVYWYAMAPNEVPEPLLVGYRKKLAEGGLTLDDVAAFALWAGDRHIKLPRDLRQVGLYPHRLRAFYATLTKDQVSRARSPAGLSFEEMTIAQQQQVRERAAERTPPISAAEISKAVFQLKESVWERGTLKRVRYDLILRFGDQSEHAPVVLRPPTSPPWAQ